MVRVIDLFKDITITTVAGETSSGPAYFMLEDPDCNPILIDQHV